MKEAEDRAEQAGLEREKQRQKRLQELDERRLGDLRLSGELLRQAQDIRALVERVRMAITKGSVRIDESRLATAEFGLEQLKDVPHERSG